MSATSTGSAGRSATSGTRPTPSANCSLTEVDGGITAPQGFSTGAVLCGIKPTRTTPDVAVLAADRPVPAAALFTTNLAQAAPVTVSKQHLAHTHGMARAVVVNSGCANACTGAAGMGDAQRMARETATALGCAPEDVLVASTGVIGVALPIDRLAAAIHAAAGRLSPTSGASAAQAIMTTDQFPKEHAVRVDTPRGSFTVGGMAKGAGMIEPNMATMLGFLTTDAQVSPAMLHRALLASAHDTFNAITVDGECSTNDTLFALASGASRVEIDEALYPSLVEGLRAVSHKLALDIVRDGEGATKVVAVTVSDAPDVEVARRVARTIANSPLVKTAIHGGDPNWGRIVAAAGRSGATFDIDRVTVHVGGILLFENGLPHDDAAPAAAEHLQGRQITIDVSLGVPGGMAATIWTCDLSAEYVRINGEYRT